MQVAIASVLILYLMHKMPSKKQLRCLCLLAFSFFCTKCSCFVAANYIGILHRLSGLFLLEML